jgi:hypothetical protein
MSNSIAIDKLSNGSVWSFRPTSSKAARTMRKLFPDALWNRYGGCMLVEHRYEVGVAQRLVEHGLGLVRETDGVAVSVVRGRFVVNAEVES